MAYFFDMNLNTKSKICFKVYFYVNNLLNHLPTYMYLYLCNSL